MSCIKQGCFATWVMTTVASDAGGPGTCPGRGREAECRSASSLGGRMKAPWPGRDTQEPPSARQAESTVLRDRREKGVRPPGSENSARDAQHRGDGVSCGVSGAVKFARTLFLRVWAL